MNNMNDCRKIYKNNVRDPIRCQKRKWRNPIAHININEVLLFLESQSEFEANWQQCVLDGDPYLDEAQSIFSIRLVQQVGFEYKMTMALIWIISIHINI